MSVSARPSEVIDFTRLGLKLNDPTHPGLQGYTTDTADRWGITGESASKCQSDLHTCRSHEAKRGPSRKFEGPLLPPPNAHEIVLVADQEQDPDPAVCPSSIPASLPDE